MRLHLMRLSAFSAILLVGHVSHAQSADGPPGPGDVGPVRFARPFAVLHLDATASVQVPPDQLVADLVAQSSTPTAAAAQRQVNGLMDAGMKEAGAVAGVDARTTGYSVESSDDKRTSWTAQQTLGLRGHDGRCST